MNLRENDFSLLFCFSKQVNLLRINIIGKFWEYFLLISIGGNVGGFVNVLRSDNWLGFCVKIEERTGGNAFCRVLIMDGLDGKAPFVLWVTKRSQRIRFGLFCT